MMARAMLSGHKQAEVSPERRAPGQQTGWRCFQKARMWVRFIAPKNGFIGRLASWGFVRKVVQCESQVCLADSRGDQLFLLPIFRFRTISFRLSKLETVFVGDFAPSFSA